MFEGSPDVILKSTGSCGSFFIRNRRRQRNRQHKDKQAAQPQLQLAVTPQAIPNKPPMTALNESDLWMISRRAIGTTWRSVTGMILNSMRGTTMTRMTLGEIITFID